MQIKVGLVGFGFMGQMHARVYQALPGVEIVGIADSSPKVRALAAERGIDAPVFNSIEELLEKTQANVVDICLPTHLHVAAIMAAATQGRHIMCEKPFALEVEEAEKALTLIESEGVIFQVGHCIRFWPEYQALEKFVKSKAGGRLISLSLQRRAGRPGYSEGNWLMDDKRSKGAALDLHIHDTDYVLHLLGKPRAVRSVGGGLSRIFTQYLFDDVAVTAEGAWDLPPKWGFQMAFQAVFENAVVDFDSTSSPSLRLTSGEGTPEALPFDAPVIKSSTAGAGNISDLGGYYNELACFCDCVCAGRPPEIATGRQALESLRAVLAEIESAATHKEVVLA